MVSRSTSNRFVMINFQKSWTLSCRVVDTLKLCFESEEKLIDARWAEDGSKFADARQDSPRIGAVSLRICRWLQHEAPQSLGHEGEL